MSARIGQTDDHVPDPIRVGSWVFRPGLWVSHKVALVLTDAGGVAVMGQPLDAGDDDSVLTECSRLMQVTTGRGRLAALVPGVLYQPCADCSHVRGKPSVFDLLDEDEPITPQEVLDSGLPG